MKLSLHHTASAVALGLALLLPPILPLMAQDEAPPGAAREKGKREAKAPKGGRDREPARHRDDDDEGEGPGMEPGMEREGKGLEIGKLLPLNKPNLQVKIPGFDKGELASMIEAEKLTRIDEVNLRLEDATIELVKQELLIKLRSALYNTEGAILSSNDSTTVSSRQFTMTGDTMDFDTKTGKGRMRARPDGTGMVRMIIHNVDAMDGKEKPAAAPTSEASELPAAAPSQPEPISKK